MKEECEKEVEEIMKEIPIALMLTHVYWGLWGIHMSKDPNINFDYLLFSYLRMEKYKQIRQKYFGK